MAILTEPADVREMKAPNSDRPLTNPADDKYGFVELASRLAAPIAEATAGDGLVVGVEGRWGSGKTTLLEFLSHKLRQSEIEGLHTITIAPWLHGNRVEIASELLAKLGEALDAETKQSKTKAKRDKLKETLGRYAILAGRGSAALLDAAGDLVPGGGLAARGTRLATDVVEGLMGGQSLTELKAAIRKQILESSLRFVVVIDDLDRLEPSQAAEVVRIVKSVADFPRVVYVLSYDRDVLAHALEQSLSVKDGARYLQKVVQLSLPMPAFEPFDLRLQLRDQLRSLYLEFESIDPDAAVQADLERAVDQAGAFLTTPREVTLVVNAVRFAWHAARFDTYFPDVCTIQVYKIVRRDLYDWLEEYLALRSVMVTGAGQIGNGERVRLGNELHRLLPDDDVSSNSIYALTGIVPGLSQNVDPAKRVFEVTYDKDIAKLIDRRRLGSPIHSRAYFAFAIPKTVMSDGEWKSLLDAAEINREAFELLILKYSNSQRPVGGSWLRHVLDRLDEITIARMSVNQLSNMLAAFANVMDDVARQTGRSHFFFSSDDQKADRVAWSLARRLKIVDASRLVHAISDSFQNGRALGWLVGEFFRTELFTHGQAGNGRPSSESPLFSEAEVDHAREVLGSRINDVAIKGKVLELPNPLRFLFGWRDTLGEASVRAWAAKIAESDLSFVQLMYELRSSVLSDQEYSVIRNENVSAFLDFDQATKRIRDLVNSTEPQVSETARKVQEAIEASNNW